VTDVARHRHEPNEPDYGSDDQVRVDVKASLRKMVIALARQAAYQDHLAAMSKRES